MKKKLKVRHVTKIEVSLIHNLSLHNLNFWNNGFNKTKMEEKYLKNSMFIFSITIIPECLDNVHISVEFFESILKLDKNINMSKILKSEILCIMFSRTIYYIILYTGGIETY